MESWDKRDIYAISLYVCDEGDNPCEPTVTLGYNTETCFRERIKDASDAIEARWNYAFWLQNEEYVFGAGETQPMVRRWIEGKGFRYYSYEEMFADEEPDPETYEGITDAFVEELVELVKELHGSGFIKEQFGKPIPMLIHELEYCDQILEQNLRANPKDTVEGFARFCKWDKGE